MLHGLSPLLRTMDEIIYHGMHSACDASCMPSTSPSTWGGEVENKFYIWITLARIAQAASRVFAGLCPE